MLGPGAAPVTLMLAKSLLTLAASFAIACSDGEQTDAAHCGPAGPRVSGVAGANGLGGGTGDDSLIVPAGLAVTARPGINSVFNVTALTLRPGPNGVDLYAAVRNDGDIVACNASFSVELRDKDDQNVAVGVSGLMSSRYYRFRDGSEGILGCVAPADVTMVGIRSMALDTPLEAVVNVVYQSNYWGNLDLVAIDGVSLASVQAVSRSPGVAYTGTLVNGLDVELSSPTVAVFPLNAVGRPLGAAYGGSSVVLPACGTWDFETTPINEAGVSFAAYPMGGP
jgi:hypothetical protein